MENQSYLLSHLAGIFHTGVFSLQGERLISYEDNPDYNPIYSNQALRLALTRGANTQQEPFLMGDDFHVLFLCVKREDRYYMAGPFSTRDMKRVERHRYYRRYGIGERLEKGLRYYKERYDDIREKSLRFQRKNKSEQPGYSRQDQGNGWDICHQ